MLNANLGNNLLLAKNETMNINHASVKYNIVYTKLVRRRNHYINEKNKRLCLKSFYFYLCFTVSVLLNSFLVIYLSLPFLPILLNVIAPLNESRPFVFNYYAEYFIDEERYAYELTLHASIVLTLSVQVIVGLDSMYIQCVQHLNALFSIVG
jgi:hypothetical protein